MTHGPLSKHWFPFLRKNIVWESHRCTYVPSSPPLLPTPSFSPVLATTFSQCDKGCPVMMMITEKDYPYVHNPRDTEDCDGSPQARQEPNQICSRALRKHVTIRTTWLKLRIATTIRTTIKKYLKIFIIYTVVLPFGILRHHVNLGCLRSQKRA